MLNGNSRCFRIHGITPEIERQIYAFLQGAVYCWCKNRPDEWFSARDFVGGDNYYWQGTPAFPLYEYYASFEIGDDYAISEAGKALGRLLKRVIVEDKRTFDTRNGYMSRQYRWTGEEDDNHIPQWLNNN